MDEHKDNVCNLNFYDSRNYSAGPYNQISVEDLCDVKQISYNIPSSMLMLVSSQNDSKKPQIKIIDPFSNATVCSISGIVNDDSKYVEAVFTPNSEMVLTGGSDGCLRAFSTSTGEQIWKSSFHPKNL